MLQAKRFHLRMAAPTYNHVASVIPKLFLINRFSYATLRFCSLS